MRIGLDYLKIMGLLVTVLLVLWSCVEVVRWRAREDAKSGYKYDWPTLIWMIVAPTIGSIIITCYIYLVWPIN